MDREDLQRLGWGIVNNDEGWIDLINDEDLQRLGWGIVNNDEGWIDLI